MREEIRLDELVSKAAGGDRAALQGLLLHFHDPLLAFIRSRLSSRFHDGWDPEDLLQDVYVDVFRHAARLEPKGSRAFFGWIKTIAINRGTNLAKARKALKRGGGTKRLAAADIDSTATSVMSLLASEHPTPSRIAGGREMLDAVREALDGLGAERRHAVQLRFGKGLSVREIAERTGKNPGAVKMLIHRAVNDLRHAVGERFSSGL